MANINEIKNVMLIGGSGNMGAIILQGLIDAGFNVSVLTRPSSTGNFPASMKVVRAEYTQAELVRAFQGQDAVVSAIGAMGFQDQILLIDAAIEAGVKRFMPSEMSGNTLSDAVRGIVPVFEPKKTVLEYLKTKQAQISWTGLATGFLLDWSFQTGFLDFDPAQKTAKIWDDGNKVFSCITATQLGQAVAGVLKAPSETANQYLYVSTCAISQNQLLKIVEKQTGSTWPVKHVKSEDEIASARKLVAEGDFNGIFTLAKASAWSNVPGLRSDFATDEKLSNEVVGLPQSTDREEVLRSVLVK